MGHMLFFGFGFCAKTLAPLLRAHGWQLSATCRDDEKYDLLEAQGVTPLKLANEPIRPAQLAGVSHILLSAAPDENGDPALPLLKDALEQLQEKPAWIGYLSTTGVYGDHEGEWVDESAPLTPATKRGKLRVMAETQWRDIDGLPLHIFRLAGIYGPGRGPFEKVRKGTARRIIKQGQVFSRTHVEDIAQVLEASVNRPNPGAAYNVCDNDPAPPQDVIAYAAELLGLPVPPEVPFEEAEMSPMARSFYAESKKVDNRRIREELGVELTYPDYRTGLKALLAEAG